MIPNISILELPMSCEMGREPRKYHDVYVDYFFRIENKLKELNDEKFNKTN